MQINDTSQSAKLHAKLHEKERAFVTLHVNIYAENESIGKHCNNVTFPFFIMLESK